MVLKHLGIDCADFENITFAFAPVDKPFKVPKLPIGFVWMKRKHYFKPELNQHFFDNYFKV